MDEISYSGGGRSIRRKLPKRLVLFAVFFVIILLLLGGVVFFVTRGGAPQEETKKLTLPEESQEEIASPSPEVSETPSPAPTSEAKLNKSTLRVSVQNGSGESGVAGKIAGVLRTAGYDVVSTGNADNFDYTDVTIQVKSSKKSILADLEKALSAKYTVSDTSTDLPESTNYDALVIIGK